MVETVVTQHPVALEIVGRLRSPESAGESFRTLLRRYAEIVGVEASAQLHVVSRELATATGHRAEAVHVADPVTLVPVLRAGLGMLDGLLNILPNAAIGFVGIARDEETCRPSQYYCNLPAGRGGICMILEPMIATGGSLGATISLVEEKVRPREIYALSVIASPEGIASLRENDHSGRAVTIFTGSIDERLDERGYIVPGLGDAGDRICDGN